MSTPGEEMNVDGKNLRPIWLDEDTDTVKIIDQRLLPHEFVVVDLETVDQAIMAIAEMYVRGAPLIGATGAWGGLSGRPDGPAKQQRRRGL